MLKLLKEIIPRNVRRSSFVKKYYVNFIFYYYIISLVFPEIVTEYLKNIITISDSEYVGDSQHPIVVGISEDEPIF
jgi:hypothetical protein